MSYNDEDHSFVGDNKENKRFRKMISAKDRSIHKKSNQRQLRQKGAIYSDRKTNDDSLLRGRVISIKGLEISVSANETLYSCVLRGFLKRDRVRLKNIITVGDIVLFKKLNDDEGVIEQVEERYSTLSRAETLSHQQEQLLAANIDQVLITTSLGMPPFKTPIIDRYIIAAKKGNMLPIIVINKIDLLPEIPLEEKSLYEEFILAFKNIDIPVIPVSTLTKQGIDDLKLIMQDKASVFAGQSGTGKSSLINTITGLDLQVGEPVEKTKKGSHTTTTAKLIPLSSGGWCVDTPGIKSFGIWSLEKAEISRYFPDIYYYGQQCKFPNCSHLHEPGCNVQKAIKEGLIAKFRFDSYQALVESIEQEHLKR